MQTHRQIAKRKTVLWQAAAIGILLAAGAAIALPSVDKLLSNDSAPRAKDPIVVPPPARPDYSVLPFHQADMAARGVGAPIPPKVEVAANPEPPDPNAHTETPQPPAPSATEWAYIGSIITSNARHALVKIDGNQEIFSIGDTHNSTKLVAVEKDHIEVEVSGAKHTIQLAERTLLAPTEPPKRAVTFRPTPAMPGSPAGVPGNGMVMAGRAGGSPNFTAEQNRTAAAAAAEAAARAKAPSDPAGMIPLEKIDGEQLQMAQKALTDVNLDPESRMKYLQQLGIGPGTPVDNALVRAKEAGLDLGSEAGKHIINAIETNAKRGK